MQIGGTEWLMIILAVALIFGATRLPQIMRGFGQGIREFKHAVRDDEAPAKPETPSQTNGDTPAKG